MPFLDIPSSEPSSSELPPLRLSQNDPGPSGSSNSRPEARLQEISITPEPSFVIKSLLTSPPVLSNPNLSSPYPAGTKIFLNVTYHALVPNPSEEEEKRGMIRCVVNDLRETVDKSGKSSLVIDTTYPTSTTTKAKKDKSFKQWLIQLTLEKVEEKLSMTCSGGSVELSRDYSEPNIKSKGGLEARLAVLPVSTEQMEELEKKGRKVKIEEVEVKEGDMTTVGAPKVEKKDNLVEEVKVEKDTPKGKKMKPRTSFEIVNSPSGRGKGKGFVLIVELPEEDISLDSPPPPTTLSLTPQTLQLSTPFYELTMELPRDVDVKSVLEPGEGRRGGAEWSVGEKALRILGELV